MSYYALLDRTPAGRNEPPDEPLWIATTTSTRRDDDGELTAVGTEEEWLAARKELLAAEKEHMRQGDELARRRRELPWVPVEKEYSFETVEGTKSLADLFDGRSQLLVYHFMFGFGYRVDEQNPGCTGCSFVADHFDAHPAPPERARRHAGGRVDRAALGAQRVQGEHGLEVPAGSHPSAATSSTTSAPPSPRSSRRAELSSTTGTSTIPSPSVRA